MSQMYKVMNGLSLPDLPEDIFLLILRFLEAWDIIRCQLVARKWREAFSNTQYLQEVLKTYPNATEIKSLEKFSAKDSVDWTTLFSKIASRYYHLGHGKARRIERYKLTASSEYGHWFPVGQWDYHESQPGGRLYHENAATHLSKLGTKPYLFRPTLWSYDHGLVVAAFSAGGTDTSVANDSTHILSLIDLTTCKTYPVPFSITGKIIRNLSLRSQTLIVEWAERHPFHDLNESEQVHRHFATCYDIVRPALYTCSPIDICSLNIHPDSSPIVADEIMVRFRNDWKLHFLGLPLSPRDRFFSTHTASHYAIYIWQPNRSMYTGDEDMPIESLSIYDISSPSSYLPSLDPSGRTAPADASQRAHIIKTFSFHDLEFYHIRQWSNIRLMSFSLDSISSTITVKENICEASFGYFDPAERLMSSTAIIIPFVGHGPAQLRSLDGELPPYRGHVSMHSDTLDPDQEDERWFRGVMDVVDKEADVRFSLVETCFTGSSVTNRLVLRIKSLDGWVVMDDTTGAETGAMGRVAGDERWIVGQNEAMELVVVRF